MYVTWLFVNYWESCIRGIGFVFIASNCTKHIYNTGNTKSIKTRLHKSMVSNANGTQPKTTADKSL